MTDEAWLSALAAELRRRGVGEEPGRAALADAASHLHDSGEDPWSAFGPPERYADAVAESLRVAVGHSSSPGPLRLKATGIRKRYGRREVLRGVDLTVHAGQIAAIVGANGSGKSTLLRICAGLASPDAGRVTIHGSVSYCPQDGGTADFLRPDEHYMLIGAGAGLSRPAARRTGRAWASRLGWNDPDPALARHLSGGTRQKLNLVMSALTEPDVLLLDEPYQGFDRGTYVSFWDELWRLRDAGTAIVVVTHLLNQLDRVDHVLDLTEAAA